MTLPSPFFDVLLAPEGGDADGGIVDLHHRGLASHLQDLRIQAQHGVEAAVGEGPISWPVFPVTLLAQPVNRYEPDSSSSAFFNSTRMPCSPTSSLNATRSVA